MTSLRLPYTTLSAQTYKAYLGIVTHLSRSSLGVLLIDLIDFRVSQINGCAFCLELHAKSLRDGGETNERIDSVAGWRVSSLFTERERAALAWAESVTHISTTGAPDDVYQALTSHFSETEISDLTFVIATINALNRMAISLRR